ncbi:MAG TPA: gamma-glutamyltransferase [Gaiellaceae bacterium]|jgi:gamma-glutamyltranspeptidase/glutathione hydrolase|nr:gamma-glutamyltransferase [Gaiellaceae bacterium]
MAPSALPAGVAAGHPQTVEAGVEILQAGGSAADAAVAASLASCVAETVMTGLLGGGHAIYLDGVSGRVRNLDCFVAVPGLGVERREPELLHLEVPFGAELVHYAVGPASCGVPGLPAGLGALWRAYGRLPWPRLVKPAVRLARAGTVFPPAHAACLAMLEPVMTMNEGATIYSPGGTLLTAGSTLRQPGLVAALEMVAEEGAASVYRGSLAAALLHLMDERGGLVTPEDLEVYEVSWSEPVGARFLGSSARTRGGLSGLPSTLERFRSARGDGEAARVLALLDALSGEADGPMPEMAGDTTNLVTASDDGSVCVLTTSLGLGSGDFLPGLDLHLNSMLGEVDLLRGSLEPGERMESMMAPTLVCDADGIVLAAGAAGGTRLRMALLTVLAGVVDEGLEPADAVARPRFHAVGGVANAEPGLEPEALEALHSRGLEVRAWESRHHYFGGVSLITRSGGAGDPRRDGAAAPAAAPTK